MGIWLELGIFVVVLAWGFWQLHDVRQARARTRAREDQHDTHAQTSPGGNATDGVRRP